MGLPRTFQAASATVLLAMAVFLLTPQLRASTTYATSVTSASSLTIPAATSGMASKDFGVYLVDGNGVKRPRSEYSYSINTSTYSVAIAFSPAFTGTVKLKGQFATDTTHGYDFLVADNAPSNQVTVCDGCVDTGTGYARRSYNGAHYVSTNKSSVTVDMDCNGLWTYAYILDNQLYFGAPNTACLSDPVNAKVTTVPYGYPAGSVPLGKVRVYYGNFQSAIDDRPF